MKNQFLALLVSFALLSLTACGNSGKEFLGKWQRVDSQNYVIEISRNGDDFVISHTGPSLMTGKIETTTVPLQYVDSVLKFDGGLVSATFSHIKATDHLTEASVMGLKEYERFK